MVPNAIRKGVRLDGWLRWQCCHCLCETHWEMGVCSNLDCRHVRGVGCVGAEEGGDRKKGERSLMARVKRGKRSAVEEEGEEPVALCGYLGPRDAPGRVEDKYRRSAHF